MARTRKDLDFPDDLRFIENMARFRKAWWQVEIKRQRDPAPVERGLGWVEAVFGGPQFIGDPDRCGLAVAAAPLFAAQATACQRDRDRFSRLVRQSGLDPAAALFAEKPDDAGDERDGGGERHVP